MSENSSIEWTDATFNPWWGCAKVSPACDNCYAERDAHRYQPGEAYWGVDADRRSFGDNHWNEPLRWNRKAIASGKRVRVFCASMADVFDKNAPLGARERLWGLIAATPGLDWQLLTKRVGNVARMVPAAWMEGAWPAHAWIGASIVTQEEAERDIPKLLALPARVRFLSCEPMLGPLDLRNGLGLMGAPGDLDWLIAGGESGPKARPMHPDWPRSLRDQCAAAGVPFLFKQWGEWAPDDGPRADGTDPIFQGAGPCARITAAGWEISKNGFTMPLGGDQEWVYRLGKRAAGRQLDGEQHDGSPT